MGFGNGFSQTFDVTAKDLNGKRVSKISENPAHEWAHQSQTFATTAKGNFYFEGPALYSYGPHFLVGFRIMPDGDRHAGAVFLNSTKHGVTTSRHKQYAFNATRHLFQVMVPELTELRHALKSCPADIPGDHDGIFARHVKKHLEHYTRPAAIYMLRYGGVANAEKHYDKLVKEADKAAADKAKYEAKRDKAQAIDLGKSALAYCGKRNAELVKALAGYVEEMRKYGHCERLERNIDHMRTAHRNLPAKTHKRLKAAAWLVLKALRNAKATGLERHEAAARNKYARGQAKAFRRYAERYVVDSKSLGQWEFQQWQIAIDWIERVRPAGNVKLRESLERTSREIAAHLEIYRQEREKREIAARAERFAKEKEARESWLAGGPRWYGLAANGTALLRVKGDLLETSQGANVPLEHAIKAFKLIRLCRERGTGWRRNGHSLRVGVYQVDSIEPNGDFKAGCHSIGWNEVERVALALGIFETAAPADTSTHS